QLTRWIASGVASILAWIIVLGLRTQSEHDYLSPGVQLTLSVDPHYGGGYPAPMILGYLMTVVLLGWAAASFAFAIRAWRRSHRT
ncbi:MAG: hypothetical protein ACYCZK_06995, partial [Microbacteriaceae bacterium]